jgi:pentatricopeptide repeat protein
MWYAWDKMKQLSVKPNAPIYTFIISAFVRDGNLEMATQYLFAMKSQNIVPELSAVQAVIILAAESGYPRLALDLATYFEDVSHRRLEDAAWVACLYSAAQALYVRLCIANPSSQYLLLIM